MMYDECILKSKDMQKAPIFGLDVIRDESFFEWNDLSLYIMIMIQF